MTAEQPFVAEWVTHGAGAFPIELIFERSNNRGASVNRLLEGLVHIGYVQMN